MPLPKQTNDLIFALQAIIFRIRQLIKERRGYSKTKARELAKLLREGRVDFARIKTEDVIANDNLIAALEIIELHCEQLHVRANILDHLAFGQKKKGKQSTTARKRPNHPASREEANRTAGGGGWGIWSLLGLGGSPKSPRQINDESHTAGEANNSTRPTLEANEDHKCSDDAGKGHEPENFIDPELDRAAGVIFYSYPRLPRDITGLPELRMKLIQRWGNDFANRLQNDDDLPVELPEELIERLRVQKASPILVEKYLGEIARSHGIPWHQDEEEDELLNENSQPPEPAVDDTGPHSDVAPSSKSAGVLPSNVKDDPSAPDSKPETSSPQHQIAEQKDTARRGVPDVDELAKRFAALKK